MSKVAVVIPIYKEEIDDLEKISLAQCRKVLGHYPIVFAAPEGKNFSYLEPGDMLVQFHPQYFQNTLTYSQLLLQPFFYEPFLSFDYILIYQLDAFVFYDALEEFCRLGYDYIGAPWPVSWGFIRVGNGGFCLRKVKTCHRLVTEVIDWQSWLNYSGEHIPTKYGFVGNCEDSFFAFCGANKDIDFNVAPVKVAKLFSMESYPDRCVKILGYELPFGCHGWTKFSADFYVELFAKFGYDLRPLRNQMQVKDYEFYLPRFLEMVAMERLIRDLDRKKSLVQYLPTKKFATVRVVRSSGALKILARLLTEENSLADKIFIYDKESRELFHDVSKEDSPQLIISEIYDKSLIDAVKNKNVISFQREYMKEQEKLFHRLIKER